MGSFDSTCSITRTSIHVGDEVLMVALVPKNIRSKNTHDLLSDIFRYTHTKEKGGAPVSPYRFVGFGIYDDYGSIEGRDEETDLGDKDWWDYQFMCHRSAVEGLLPKPFEEYEDYHYALYELIELCYIARIQLLGNELLGAQYFDTEEIEIQRKVLTLTEQVLDMKERCLKEDN